MYLDNLKNTNHSHISQTATDLCDSKLSKNIQFEKDNHLFFFNISGNLEENQSLKVILWKNCAFSLTPREILGKVPHIKSEIFVVYFAK